MFTLFAVQRIERKTRKPALSLVEGQGTLFQKISFDVHACLLSRSDGGRLIVDRTIYRPSSTVHRPENKKSFIHIRDEGRIALRGTTRITFSSWNVQTFKPANVTLVAVTGFPGADYFSSPAQSSFEKQASSVVYRVPVDTGAGLPPRCPNSLTGWPTTPALTFYMFRIFGILP